VVQVTLGLLTSAIVVVQALLLAHIIAGVFLHAQQLAQMALPLVLLGMAAVGRGATTWATSVAGQRGAAVTISQLRARLLEKLAALGPVRLGTERTGELALLATSGLDALDIYFGKYLPQLLLAVLLPIMIIAVVIRVDLIAALILVLTVPLIPLFMALVGKGADWQARRRYRSLALLSAHFLDVLQGLPTLRLFGRSQVQADRIEAIGGQYRRATMSTLKVAFLSSFMLELLATLGTALVAVAVGLRLVGGGMSLEAGLAVIILAPEVYAPLRQVAALFHAGMDGVAAAQRALDLLDEYPPTRPSAARGEGVSAVGVRGLAPDPAIQGIRLRGVRLTMAGNPAPILDGADLVVPPGETVALIGRSGAGKSTLLNVLLRFLDVDSGAVDCGDVPVRDIAVDVWRSRIAWVPQRPRLLDATVAVNVRVGEPDATDLEVETALELAGAFELIRRLPGGIETRLGENGIRLSGGQRQRIAIARALVRRGAGLLLFDEPDANLDSDSRAALSATLRLVTRGRTAIVVVHEAADAPWADRVVRLEAGRVIPEPELARQPA
jgi:thiol reductant ABC exporter CydD subunit